MRDILEEFGLQRYEGEFANGKLNGKGIMTYADGTIYEGNFKDGLEHGFGTVEYSNGDSFIGEWNQQIFKDGTYKYANGDIYTGEFNNDGRSSGNGKYTYANGDIYEGEYKNGRMHGFGKFEYFDGCRG